MPSARGQRGLELQHIELFYLADGLPSVWGAGAVELFHEWWQQLRRASRVQGVRLSVPAVAAAVATAARTTTAVATATFAASLAASHASRAAAPPARLAWLRL